MRSLLPLRAVTTGLAAATALIETVGTMGARALAGESSGSSLSRRCWQGNGRAWIEVRGLTGPNGAEQAAAVLAALRGRPGVRSVGVNRSLSRAVIEFDGDRTSLAALRSAVAAAEKCSDRTGDSGSLPGDGLLLAARAAMVGVNAAGLGITVLGRVLRLPRAPLAVEAAAAIAHYQPWLRDWLGDRIGADATDTVLSLAATAAHIFTLSPAKVSVDLTLHALRAAECHAEARAWLRHEPTLARYADQADLHPPSRSVPRPAGPADRHGSRMAWTQLIGAGAIAAATGDVNLASGAAVVAAPKAMRTAAESFAATLGQGLADRHAVLALRPDSLRRLGMVDALLIDPRVLCGDKLRVVRIRGAGANELPTTWRQAQDLLGQPGLAPGWRPVPGHNGGAEALILPAHHPLASAVVAQARESGAALVSIDVDILGELRTAFDDVRPSHGQGTEAAETLDDALAETVIDLQRAGHTVAVLSSTGAQALSSADVAVGSMANGDSPPPWNADLIAFDLAGAWQVLHALPAARQANQHGIALSTAASALGALLMVPGVRASRGPGPVTLGAAAGLLSGHLLARRVVQAPVPRPAPAYDWHAMSVRQVRDVLAPPDDPAGPAPERRAARIPGSVAQFVKAVRTELAGDPLTPVLALCSAATAVLGSPTDAALVGTVLTGNAILATAQQLQAESRLNRLLAQQTPPARIVTTDAAGSRGYREVAAEQLQVGAVIEVRSNEVVPADARVIDEEDLEVDESTLTGESLSTLKQVEATPGAELADRRCMLYAGTTVVAGTAVALVTAVGADTQARRAAELAAGELPVVGLQHQLSQLMSRAFPASAAGGVLVGALGVLRGSGLRQALSNAIAVAVAAVPEGMPLMATLAQHASAQRLSKAGVLVRIPRSAEALGRVGVVCFDKTGTLSENRLRVSRVHPVAEYSRDDVLRCAAHAAPTANGVPLAHATDRAIVEAAAGAGRAAARDAHLPFRSGRAFSASVSGTELTVKGAPEVVLAACDDVGAEADITVAELAAAGLRVITVARRQLTAQQTRAIRKDPDTILKLCRAELTLAGFLGLSDTPRAQAPQLLAGLADRGVDIRLITGDHPVTAAALAEELGVPVGTDQLITGSEWDALSRNEQQRVVAERVIFARMSPENKVQVVQALERTGRVCAMVGDGANDAAAIRAASVGVGVVTRGSDAAHATADVVLTDGRIETLLDAIDEGRRLWRGVWAAVCGLLGGNAGEVIFAVVGSALTGNAPLNTRQLLLMNMLTDALPATAVAVSTPAGPVRRVGRGIDAGSMWRAVAVRGGITAAAATAAWTMAMFSGFTGRRQRASTVALIALVAVELGQTLVDSRAPLVLATVAGSFAAFMAMVNTPVISQLLGCTPIGPLGWAQGLGAAAAAIVAVAVTDRLRPGQRGAHPPADVFSHRDAVAA